MKSETLRNIRTMRQVKSSLEVAAHQHFRTTNSLFKTAEEIKELESEGLQDNRTAQILARERARATKFEASVDRSQRKLLNSRKKIAGLVNRNRALTTLRHDIQHERDLKKSLTPAIPETANTEKSAAGSLRGIELKY